jgi:hypothetical protein
MWKIFSVPCGSTLYKFHYTYLLYYKFGIMSTAVRTIRTIVSILVDLSLNEFYQIPAQMLQGQFK